SQMTSKRAQLACWYHPGAVPAPHPKGGNVMYADGHVAAPGLDLSGQAIQHSDMSLLDGF
ncbi:MAG: H-X9-DG-CTERM domain-containing protein, partial [Lentisphaeria bacterium]